jgi:hypothetical protein
MAVHALPNCFVSVYRLTLSNNENNDDNDDDDDDPYGHFQRLWTIYKLSVWQVELHIIFQTQLITISNA